MPLETEWQWKTVAEGILLNKVKTTSDRTRGSLEVRMIRYRQADLQYFKTALMANRFEKELLYIAFIQKTSCARDKTN